MAKKDKLPGKKSGKGGKKKDDLLHCFNCDQICCRTAAIEVDSPKSLRDYSDMLFYLYHFNTQVVIAKNAGKKEWYVEFMTPCRHLVNGRCDIYEWRPIVCRKFEMETCERNMPQNFTYIKSPEELFAYLKKKGPKKILKKLEKTHLPPARETPAPKKARNQSTHTPRTSKRLKRGTPG